MNSIISCFGFYFFVILIVYDGNVLWSMFLHSVRLYFFPGLCLILALILFWPFAKFFTHHIFLVHFVPNNYVLTSWLDKWENLLFFFYQSSGVWASVCYTFFCAQNISLFNEIFYTLCIDCADTSMHQTFSFWTAESSEVPGTHANDVLFICSKKLLFA